MNVNREGGRLRHISPQRTKCSGLIIDVMFTALRSDLMSYFQNQRYARTVYESTDFSAKKHLYILIRFLSNSKNEIYTGFLGLILVGDIFFNSRLNHEVSSLSRKPRPWSVANQLHGQRTGAFSWRPVLRPFQEDIPIPTRPYPDLRTWTAV